MTKRNPLVIPCCPTRAYAHPAPTAEVVFIAEPVPVQTRTALVLGVRVEIPLKPAR